MFLIVENLNHGPIIFIFSSSDHISQLLFLFEIFQNFSFDFFVHLSFIFNLLFLSFETDLLRHQQKILLLKILYFSLLLLNCLCKRIPFFCFNCNLNSWDVFWSHWFYRDGIRSIRRVGGIRRVHSIRWVCTIRGSWKRHCVEIGVLNWRLRFCEWVNAVWRTCDEFRVFDFSRSILFVLKALGWSGSRDHGL